MLFTFFISFLILVRLIELYISKVNEKWLRAHGAIEFGKGHYKFIVLLHVCFYLSLILEYNIRDEEIIFNSLNSVFLVFFFFLQIGRAWVIISLGRYWNTKILRIPNAKLIEKGPYKYFKHPNYIIVTLEILSIPLIFDLYFTAIIFSILNLIVLAKRIRVEEKALKL